MLIDYVLGQTGIILRVKIRNSSVSTGAGLTGLTSASSGLRISTIADNESSAAAYTVAGSTIESITTLGTYAAPTATKARFKELDATNHPGVYEIQIANARFAVSSAKNLLVSISGASNAAECDVLIPLRTIDPYVSGGVAPADVTKWNGTAVPASDTAGYPKATLKTGTGAGELSVSGGAVATQDSAGVTTLLARLTSARAGYLDNLNAGGVLASQADINALNQSASRRVILTTVGQYERPESGSTTYWIDARTYDGDGAAVNADSTPTLTATGITTGSLSANLSVASNPSTGLYRWTYTVASNATIEAVRFDLSAVISSSTFPISVHTQVADFVAATWTTADRVTLNNVSSLTNQLTTDMTTTKETVIDTSSAIANLPENVWEYAPRTLTDKTGFKLASDGLDAVATTAPAGVASNFREMVVQTWRRFFKKATATSTQVKTYADNGTSVLTTQAVSDDGTTQTQGAAS
jgi:hypothetical protein